MRTLIVAARPSMNRERIPRAAGPRAAAATMLAKAAPMAGSPTAASEGVTAASALPGPGARGFWSDFP
jgi:hypothetical protein